MFRQIRAVQKQRTEIPRASTDTTYEGRNIKKGQKLYEAPPLLPLGPPTWESEYFKKLDKTNSVAGIRTVYFCLVVILFKLLSNLIYINNF